MLEKENPDLYTKIYEPEKLVQKLAEAVSEKLNLTEASIDADIPVAETEETAEEVEKKRQTRGGKGLIRDESAKLDKEALKRSVIYPLYYPTVLFILVLESQNYPQTYI